MTRLTIPRLSRRTLMQGAGAVAATPLVSALARSALAQSGEAINFTAWSAAVDQAKSHVDRLREGDRHQGQLREFPAAQFRATLVTKFTANEPLDVIWMNDAWTPEFAEAGWIVPIDDRPELMKYNAEIEKYCVNAMTYKGKQYGLVYYADHMAFMYNVELLQKAGITTPPASWDEVVQQSLKIKQAGGVTISADARAHRRRLAGRDGGRSHEFLRRPLHRRQGQFRARRSEERRAPRRQMDHRRHQHPQDRVARRGRRPARSTRSRPSATAAPPLRCCRATASVRSTIRRSRRSPGKIRIALMPQGTGTGAGHYTCGWVRYFGVTPHARANKEREAKALKLVEWFGGKANNEYVFQKMLMLDLGVPFCTTPLNNDKDIIAFYDKWVGGADIINKQASLAVTKDVITPWFGEWNETNNQAWQSIFLGKVTAEAGPQEPRPTSGTSSRSRADNPVVTGCSCRSVIFNGEECAWPQFQPWELIPFRRRARSGKRFNAASTTTSAARWR